jgi:conjugal transfer pilus assembly protein TraU
MGEKQKVRLRYSVLKICCLIILLLWQSSALFAGNCHGRFLNPISDICWKCIFPIKIAGFQVASGRNAEPESGVNSFICLCTRAGIPNVPGIPISFWEPVRLVDVTRTPYCLVNMGGIQAGSTGIRGRGDVAQYHSHTQHSFYHVHWYVYPIIHWLELFMDFMCLEKSNIDLLYITELDPFWNDDEKSQILNPEAILFGSVLAQTACAADCIAASARLPLDALFWCGGCQGSIYPYTGTVGAHNGGVQASLLLTTRMIAKLHREGLLWGYMGFPGLCGKYPMPLIRKSQYRTQMTYPIPQSRDCQPLGATEVPWQARREFPYQGSDFGYLVWRKRDCCLL